MIQEVHPNPTRVESLLTELLDENFALILAEYQSGTDILSYNLDNESLDSNILCDSEDSICQNSQIGSF